VKPNSVTHNQIQQKHSETPKHWTVMWLNRLLQSPV
jgi:hypothetical protein